MTTTPESYSHTLFLLGATGYIGGQLLVHLAQQLPNVRVVVLVRNANEERTTTLHKLNPNVQVAAYTGSYETALDIIKENTERADIVVHAGDGDVEVALQAIFEGLEESAKRRQAAGLNPPTYIHLTGYALLSDNTFGTPLDLATAKPYTDTQFDIKEFPETNLHYKSDRAVIEFGDRKDIRVNTSAIYFGWVYGVGEGLQKTSVPLRFYIQVAKGAGHSITFGPGLNRITTIHVKDAANCIVALIIAGIEGTAASGTNGVYFASSDVRIPLCAKQMSDIIGDALYECGHVSQPGSQPISDELLRQIPKDVADALSGSPYPIPRRLKEQFGIELIETQRYPLLESLAEEVKVASLA
ncbi:hypothetical protein AX16_000096 [Volvariella volvacea WC 439]|nr:hypothetical protein AX16_000096 [Volvariella volvacea WC 439]